MEIFMTWWPKNKKAEVKGQSNMQQVVIEKCVLENYMLDI
jgi:membrane-bound inhibitor of C-type lysozyme